MKNRDEIWIAAYSVSAAIILLGAAIRGTGVDKIVMDQNARSLADQVTDTIEERAGKKKGKEYRSGPGGNNI